MNLEGDLLEDLQTLQEMGLIRFNGLTCTMTTLAGNVIIANFRDIAVAAFFEAERKIKFETIILSPVAREIMQVVRPQPSEEQIEYIIEKFKAYQPKVIAKVPFVDEMTLQWEKMNVVFQLNLEGQ